MKEITKLEKTSLSDFMLCVAELLHAEERKTAFFSWVSLVVCAAKAACGEARTE